MRHHRRWAVVLLALAALQLSACAQASPPKATASVPARLEPIEGTGLARVVLTEQAAKRLGIQTVAVREERLTRKRVVGGAVVAPDARPVPGLVGALVRVRLTVAEAGQVDRAKPALVLPLTATLPAAGANVSDGRGSGTATTAGAGEGLTARLVDVPSDGSAQSASPAVPLYYLVDGARPNLAPGQSVLIELPLTGGEALRKLIPYSAVIYGLGGETWVYTSPEPLVFVRDRVAIDYIDEELAVLSAGPPVGSGVVTVGVTELYGTEVKVGK